MTSILLVAAQMVLIVAIVSQPLSAGWQPIPAVVIGGILVLDALILGIWALISMRRATFSVMPEPKTGGELVTRGPYRWVRHPMYSAVLLLCIGVCLMRGSLLQWVLLIALLGVLVVKLQREERLLAAQYEGYTEYAQQTHRLVPYVY